MTEPTPTPEHLYHINRDEFVGRVYSEEQILNYGEAEYERALLDAMNATRAFGKTGEVIAVIIAALKEKKV